MLFKLEKASIEKASEVFAHNQNFTFTVLPRLKAIYAIKKEFKHLHELEWQFEYDHVNVNQNRLLIEYKQNKSNDFSFFYEVPLSSNFEFRVYFAKSSIHFLDIYNFLLSNEIISENQFRLKAEYHTIPHFIINQKVKRYNTGILNKIQTMDDFDGLPIDDNIKNEFDHGFQIFNPIFNQVLSQFQI
ncbi:hypothetical protein [Marinifilum caeruleilacunae]|uniref:Uncharacterized protein n=1 Tax=Marinifilum caeruleilacunae TaxID=2499076 RepID=A0ABX1WY03_9BACT|nr:hypothetical protein [Marinifilum caeruleilacunae]NOU60876.1 hypothetical protein [Marinifilum caeruleilacunae]